MELNQIFRNNKEWVASKLSSDPEYFSELAKGQQPEILYIGCSDSRVASALMMGAEPGDLFVLRNIANIASPSDPAARAVIHYAVSNLLVKHIVVCGHYGCGGVAAAMQPDDQGALEQWITPIRQVILKHTIELQALSDPLVRYRRLVELNVQEQCQNVRDIPEVKEAIATRKLAVHGWVYDLDTGKLIDLGIDVGG